MKYLKHLKLTKKYKMTQEFRLEGIGLLNRNKKYYSNLMEKIIQVMKATL